MSRREKSTSEKPDGPATGLAAPVRVRLQPEQLERLDAWSRRHGEIGRPEALRRLIDHALADGGPTILSAEQKIARAKRKLAKIAVPDEPSPEKGVAMLRRGKAEAGLAGLKARTGADPISSGRRAAAPSKRAASPVAGGKKGGKT